jgi:hypothetical protein
MPRRVLSSWSTISWWPREKLVSTSEDSRETDTWSFSYLADRVVVFGGQPGINAHASEPESLLSGCNKFLKSLDVTFRRDPTNYRPRINKANSQLDQEQKLNGNYVSHTFRHTQCSAKPDWQNVSSFSWKNLRKGVEGTPKQDRRHHRRDTPYRQHRTDASPLSTAGVSICDNGVGRAGGDDLALEEGGLSDDDDPDISQEGSSLPPVAWSHSYLDDWSLKVMLHGSIWTHMAVDRGVMDQAGDCCQLSFRES